MSYLKFDKQQLVNLEYSLQREILRSNRAGSYSCTTLSGCNTRKYHGLLVCPNYALDGGKHVLLSSLDATIIQHGAEFNLGIHKYPGEKFEPRGHKYIRDINLDELPIFTYRVGGVVLSMERLLVEKKEQILIRYTLKEAHSPTKLRLKPFLAFRNMHQLSKQNMYANTKYDLIENGMKICLYDGYPQLHMQISKENEYIPNPDWYKDVEYFQEKLRGYEYNEDLYTPGYFEFDITPGESVVISASTFEAKPAAFKSKFTREVNKKTPRTSFFGCLQNSAEQFFVNAFDFSDVQAGYPWYNGRINQTFVALPGLAIALDDNALIKRVIRTNISRLKNGLFPVRWGKFETQYTAADTPLWLFWTVQKLIKQLGGKKEVWKTYKTSFKKILQAYQKGTKHAIQMDDSGLINADETGTALTWMNAYSNGKPVTPRYGKAVEINALWYNALRFSIDLANESKDTAFVNYWLPITERIEKSFIETFWDEEKAYLADFVHGDYKDWAVRPNQVIAAAMPYTPLSLEMKKSILSLAKKDLVTPLGLRTLSPRNPNFKGTYEGGETEREEAMHQGSVFPWLIGFFIEGYLSVHKNGGLSYVQRILDGFEAEMTNGCIGSISELYDGNPPHAGKGAISQAWNIGQILRAFHIIDHYK